MTAPGELPVRVYYEDTGVGGLVYPASSLRFAERGRTELLRNLGFDQRVLARDHGVIFAVARCELAFLRPARLDDLLIVRTRAVALGGARIEMAQRIDRNGALLVEIELVLAVLRAGDLRPTRLPEPLRLAFARLP